MGHETSSLLSRLGGTPDTTNKPDATIKKVEAASSPRGEMGQKYLVAGKRLSMRLWIDEPGKAQSPTTRDYDRVRHFG